MLPSLLSRVGSMIKELQYFAETIPDLANEEEALLSNSLSNGMLHVVVKLSRWLE